MKFIRTPFSGDGKIAGSVENRWNRLDISLDNPEILNDCL
jgi:hypothetical protein